MDPEAILGQLGGYGKFQVLVYLALGLVNMRGSWHVFITMFTGWTPPHHCTPPVNHSLNQSLPMEDTDSGGRDWSTCFMYERPGSENELPSNNSVKCQHGWTYLWDDEGGSSIVSDWNLLCGDDYLVELSSTMYMVGTTCGTIFLTPLSDRWGRKTVLLACLWVQAVVGICLAFMPSIIPFVVLQFFIGITNMTIALCAYVLIVETFAMDTRELPALSLQFFWAGGIMVLSLFAYLVRDWRHLQLLVSLPQVLTIAYFWLLPESLTWLLVKGKVSRAKDLIVRVLRVNILPPIDNLDQTLAAFKDSAARETTFEVAPDKPAHSTEDLVKPAAVDTSSYTLLHLFKTPRIRMYSIFMFYLYLVNSLAYFGISFGMPSLNGDRFLNFFISGAVEVPAYIICIICNRRVGRRLPICVFLVICAVANIAFIFTPDQSDDGRDLSALKTTLVMIGKFGITGSYSALYLYGSEIFPTSIRNHAVGLSSFFENIGSITAPQIVYASKSLSNLPMTLFAVMTLVGAVDVLFLPETHNMALPTTIEDVENWAQRRKGVSGGTDSKTTVSAGTDRINYSFNPEGIAND